MAIEFDEQLQYIQLWEESGLTKAEFCRQIGIGYSNFMKWIYRHTNQVNNLSLNRHRDTKTQRIVPVSITEVEKSNNASSLIIHLKDSCLEIPPGFPSQEVENIIKLLY